MDSSDFVATRSLSANPASYPSQSEQNTCQSRHRKNRNKVINSENIIPIELGKIALTKAIAELARNAQNQNLVLTYEALTVAHNVLLFEINSDFRNF